MTVRTWLRGIPVDRLDLRELFELIDEYVHSGAAHHICYLNAHCFNVARQDKSYREILQTSEAVYADGKGIVWACRWFAQPVHGRLNLGDYLPTLCDHIRERGYRLYLLGGAPGVAVLAADSLRQAHPGLDIVGCRHGYFGTADEPPIVEDIRRVKPDILLVGLGVPKQEKWIDCHLSQLQVPVCWGVGALFEYFSGKTPRAPGLLRRIGLEWIFRLFNEPGRLWRRYVLGIPRFLLSVGQAVLRDGVLVAIAWAVGRGTLEGPAGRTAGALSATGVMLLVTLLWVPTVVGLGLYRRWTRASPQAAVAAGLSGASLALAIGVLVAYILSYPLFGAGFFGCAAALLLCSRGIDLWSLRREIPGAFGHTKAES